MPLNKKKNMRKQISKGVAVLIVTNIISGLAAVSLFKDKRKLEKAVDKSNKDNSYLIVENEDLMSELAREHCKRKQ